MANITLSDIITDIRGTVGTHVYSYWKGIHLVKIRSVNYRTAHESPYRSPQKDFIARVSQYWFSGLSAAQRTGWDAYATYIATLGPPYYGPTVIKLTGLKQYGGIMSGFNAFVLTNMLRRSVGLTTILEDDPLAITPPPMPNFTNLEYLPGPPKKLKVTVLGPTALYEDTWLRIFCRGTRNAHLIIAKVDEWIIGAGIVWDAVYDCNVEPPAATPPWTLTYTDYCTALGTVIEIDTVTPGGAARCVYKRTGLALTNATGWVIEARMKVVESAVADLRLFLWFRDGVYEDGLCFSGTGIKLYWDGGTHAMDTTDDYHTYRITGKGSVVKVYVDGVLRITGTLATGAVVKEVWFGDLASGAGANSNSLWDFIKWYVGGDAPADYQSFEWEDMRYAKGYELPLQNDLYDVQLDFISTNGRYSPPSTIRSIGVYDPFLSGLWGSWVWNARVWDG